MDTKTYSRAEIVKRSRRRKKIFIEEAQKAGLKAIEIWVPDEILKKLEGKNDSESVGERLVAAVESIIKNGAKYKTAKKRMEEAEMKSYIRQKSEGL